MAAFDGMLEAMAYIIQKVSCEVILISALIDSFRFLLIEFSYPLDIVMVIVFTYFCRYHASAREEEEMLMEQRWHFSTRFQAIHGMQK